MNLPELICKVVGHDWKINLPNFCDDCLRCKISRQWELKRMAEAVVHPLRATLDYQSIGRKLLKVEELPLDDLPIYDKDL